jgi:hypothetical protein
MCMGSRTVTRSEANDVIARHTVLTCIREGKKITFDAVETEIAYWVEYSRPGSLGIKWAKLAAVTTAYKLAVTKMVEQGREDLLSPALPNSTQRRFLANLASTTMGRVSYLTVVECQEAGWVTSDSETLTLTQEGRDALAGTGAYRRTVSRSS